METQDANKKQKGLAANRYTLDIRYTGKGTQEVSTETRVLVAARIEEWWKGAVKQIQTEMVALGLKGDLSIFDHSEKADDLHTALNGVVELMEQGEMPENLVCIPDGYDDMAYFEDHCETLFECPNCKANISDVVMSVFAYDEEEEEEMEVRSLMDEIEESILLRARFGEGE